MTIFGDIDQSLYIPQIEEKTSKIWAAFSEFLPLPQPEIYYSEPKHYRVRAEFNIFHDGTQIKYFMINKVGKNKERVFLDHFDPGSQLINFFMPILATYVSNNEILKHKLFAVDFLTTISGETLITLTYHKKLDETWQNEAIDLVTKLRNHNPKIDIIGRAMKQKISIDRDYVWESLLVNGKTLKYQQYENSFTQPNAHISEKMLTWVKNNIKDQNGDLLELYCGNGNFSIALSDNFRKILATEISKTSVKSAQLNIERNNINNLKIIRMSAEEFTQALNREREFNRLHQADVNLDDYNCRTILVDPPRSGLDDKTLLMLQDYDNIVYISCNHETLINNLKVLNTSHYIDRMAFFDQFPYTNHIETGVILKKRIS